jgi:hypothetical protein
VAGRGGELLIHMAKSKRKMRGAGKVVVRTFRRVLHEDLK